MLLIYAQQNLQAGDQPVPVVVVPVAPGPGGGSHVLRSPESELVYISRSAKIPIYAWPQMVESDAEVFAPTSSIARKDQLVWFGAVQSEADVFPISAFRSSADDEALSWSFQVRAPEIILPPVAILPIAPKFTEEPRLRDPLRISAKMIDDDSLVWGLLSISRGPVLTAPRATRFPRSVRSRRSVLSARSIRSKMSARS